MSEVYAVSTFEGQEARIEKRCAALDKQLTAVENIIKHPGFLSNSLEIYDAFMFAVARAWSLVVTPTPESSESLQSMLGLAKVSPTGQVIPQGQPAASPPTGATGVSGLTAIALVAMAVVGLVVFYFDRTTGMNQPTNSTQTTGTATLAVGTTSPSTIVFVLLGFLAVLIVAPKMLEELSKLIVKEKKAKEPETLSSWLAKMLGWDNWKDGKFWDAGIMRLYWMVLNGTPYWEIAPEVQGQFSDPSNPAIEDGLSGYYRTQFRGKFRARLAHVRAVIEEAKAQRIAEIRLHTVEVSKAPAVSPRGAR
jgi:hypothetical protein